MTVSSPTVAMTKVAMLRSSEPIVSARWRRPLAAHPGRAVEDPLQRGPLVVVGAVAARSTTPRIARCAAHLATTAKSR